MGEYARAGVNYVHLQPFKDRMVLMGKRTFAFPNAAGVRIIELIHSHGAVWEYKDLLFINTTEGLGNKNWIAEVMYLMTSDPIWFQWIGVDTILMATNDLIAQGGIPAVYTDEIAVGDDSWFTDVQRAEVIVESFFRGLEMTGMALPAGETPALKFLLRSAEPVESAPSFSGTATGVINPRSRLVTGEKLAAGDVIIGVTSSGIHANGISLVIKRADTLPEGFMTKLPNGKTLGEEALLPTRNYLGFVNALLDAGVDVHAFLPGTGDGVGKLSFDKRPFTYRVTDWLPQDKIPLLFQFMLELGVSLEDCLKTFNWGMGYYVYVAPHDVDQVLQLATGAGYEAMVVGHVEDGERQTIFEPANITLPPPGD